MAFGCFVDIRQQDGSQVRMAYNSLDTDTLKYVTWIGITELTADKFAEGKQTQTNKE